VGVGVVVGGVEVVVVGVGVEEGGVGGGVVEVVCRNIRSMVGIL